MHRSTVEISGEEIFNVLLNVFSAQLSDGDIEIIPTFEFRDFKVVCKSSVVLGALLTLLTILFIG
nr:hypothetical protein [Pseudomonas syringae]UVN17905.1 hypothetical protein pPsy0479a_00073 [Pseudomonas syringae]